MSDARRGLPLLSSPPPTLAPPGSETACRRCNKEFNLIFLRSRKCNHCGYSYCHSCSDFQALMPRSGTETGYDSLHVCGFCIEFLTITASGRNSLKALPLSKLNRYVAAYDIKIDRAVEKDDIIDSILAARRPNGCLSPASENFYRKYSVPNKSSPSQRTRSLLSRSGQSSSSTPPRPPPRPGSGPTNAFPRPDLEPDFVPVFQPPPGPPPSHTPIPQQQHYPPPRPPRPPPRPNSFYAHTTTPHHQHMPAPDPSRANSSYGGHVPPTPPYMTRPQQQSPLQPNHHSSPPRAAPPTYEPPRPLPRPRTTSVAPPPNLDQLVEMTAESIGSLSISALKSILFTNHVTTGQALEKSDLVKKVLVLVEDEKAERVRQRQMEEMERLQSSMETMPGIDHFEQEEARTEQQQDGNDERDRRDQQAGRDQQTDNSSTSAPPSPPPLKPTGSTFERPGLCVICQDEDANIAIIDCGHMAMCRACSELVMASSRECPLCRSRIVTEARLLRIFRT